MDREQTLGQVAAGCPVAYLVSHPKAAAGLSALVG